MRWYERIIAAHRAVTDQVSHAERRESSRYFVWQEDGENALRADDRHGERAITGRTDLYTKQEFDEWAGALEKSLCKFGIAWSLALVDYEEDTGFFHYSWDWEVLE